MQYLVAFCSRPQAASDVLSGRWGRLIVPDKCVVRFGDLRLNRSGEIRPESVGPSKTAFPQIFRDNFRPEVASDIFSCFAVDWSVGMSM